MTSGSSRQRLHKAQDGMSTPAHSATHTSPT